jgi:integrase
MFTGARKGSVEGLRWRDVDFERKRMFFWVAKGDRPYSVPMSDKLAELLIAYRDGGEVPPSDWVFPSIRREGEHIVGVKNDREGAGPAHRLRHTFRTTLAELKASSDQSRLLMGHSMSGDVSRGYITAPLYSSPATFT